MSSWSDMDVAEYDAWLDEHDLTFQMNYQHVDSYIELLDITLRELRGHVNEEYLWHLWEQRHTIAA